MSDTIEVRSDVDLFPSMGEALDEALLRAKAEDGAVFIHSWDNTRPHVSEEDCWCNPKRIEPPKRAA